MPRRVLSGFLILVLAVVGGPVAHAVTQDAPRFALVVGNGSYPERTLPTAKADAGLVAETLAQLGFDVIALADGQNDTIQQAAHRLADTVRAAGDRSVVIVYVAGYGLQYAGMNFLVPADAAIDRQADVPVKALPLATLTRDLEALPARSRLFVFDLAHALPLNHALSLNHAAPFAKADPLPLAPGLTLTLAPRGSTYAFNAAPGSSAPVDPPLYGLYAQTLVATLRTPGLTIDALLQRVRLRVAQATGGASVPWFDSNGSGETVLLPSDRGLSTGPIDLPIEDLPADSAFWMALARDRLSTYETFVRAFPADDLTVRIKALLAVRLEAATWSESVRVDIPAAYWTYMRRYPHGPHYVDVRRRLAALRAPLEPPMRFEPYRFAGVSEPDADQVQAVAPATDPAEEPDRFVAPLLPDSLLPTRTKASDLALAPPSLVPEAALPIPPPLPAVAVAAWPATSGAIEQPFVPGLGRVTVAQHGTEHGGSISDLSTSAGLLTRTVVARTPMGQVIVQRDAADEVLSRTVETDPDDMSVSISQTGPDGGLLVKIDAAIDALGERHRRVIDGSGTLVADVVANRWDVITSVRRGPGRLAAPTFHVPALDVAPAASTPAPIKLSPPSPASGAPSQGVAPDAEHPAGGRHPDMRQNAAQMPANP